jgi:hypothetical protein
LIITVYHLNFHEFPQFLWPAPGRPLALAQIHSPISGGGWGRNFATFGMFQRNKSWILSIFQRNPRKFVFLWNGNSWEFTASRSMSEKYGA